MIVLLAAVILYAVPPDRVRLEGLKPSVTVTRSARCPDAGRLHTASVEPALLYRPQDSNAGGLRKLIDLPDGEMCLLGAAPPREDSRK